MPDLEFIAWAALLFYAGLGVTVHYHLFANFLTDAPHWVRFVSALTVGMGIGMMVCALTGSLNYGFRLSVLSVAGILVIELAAWRAGKHMSAEFAKAKYFRQNRKTMLYDWEVNAVDFVDGFRDFDEEQAKQREKTCN